ncbi:MAG: LuxR C-terminal-related transcriptional regulator [Patescibacteria group bacterium]
MTSTPLLETKFFLPSPGPGHLHRPRLDERLDRDGGRPIVLVTAPAGYGKTAMLAKWLEGLGVERRAAWLSLDPDDNDPVRFWKYVVNALARIWPDDAGPGGVLELLGSTPPPPLRIVLTALINLLASTAQARLLVLDDYHVIGNESIHESLAFFIDHLPGSFRLVLAGRNDPPLPLGRWRVRGLLTEIRAADLRFSAGEIGDLSRLIPDLELSPAELAALAGRTEGWAAGLKLAFLSLQGRDRQGRSLFISRFSGGEHAVLDYLADEVLEGQPIHVQRFLLQTSILDRMCAPLCEAVAAPRADETGPGMSARPLLDYLEHGNLFLIPLDHERRWYRYHRLFAELLRVKLGETMGDAHRRVLHRRAALWYDRQRETSEAVRHAVAAGEPDLAAAIVERAVRNAETWSGGDIAAIWRWLRVLPEDEVRARPWLRFMASGALYASGRPGAIEAVLDEVERVVREDPGAVAEAGRLLELVTIVRARFAAIDGRIGGALALVEPITEEAGAGRTLARFRALSTLGMAHLVAGEPRQAERAHREALALARETGIKAMIAGTINNLAEDLLLQGRLESALGACAEAVALCTVNGIPLPLAGLPGLIEARIRYARNELERADLATAESIDLLRQGGLTDYFGQGHAFWALIGEARGDAEGAAAAMASALRLAEESGLARFVSFASACRARLWLRGGRPDLAGRWAQSYLGEEPAGYPREFEELTLVRWLLAGGRLDEALGRLAALAAEAERAGRMGCVLEAAVLRALALQARSDEDGALAALEPALSLAEPEGFTRIFLDGGQPMRRLLQVAHRRLQEGGPGVFAGKLANLAGGSPASRAASPGALPEPLTARELEILGLLARGLSRQGIAARLYLSPYTVRAHTASIYAKLDAHSGLQAVSRARELNLLPKSLCD